MGVVSKFCADPSATHWSAVKRILRYLKGTLELQLTFDGNDRSSIQAYADADWGGCEESRRSTTGYAFVSAGACVWWSSKRQATVALFTSEAEYMACSAACQEIRWLLNFTELPSFNLPKPVILWSDNQGAILLSANCIQHQRTKHIDLRHHFIRDMVKDGQVVLKYVPTEEMVADIFTESLTAEKFKICREKLGLRQF